MTALSRMFRLAKAEIDAAENFTTEVLAAAVRENADPLLDALRRRGIRLADEGRVEVWTQVGIAGAGILDLVIRRTTPTETRELWIEVKVTADETGQQLTNYAGAIAQRTSHPTTLVLLSRHEIHGAHVWVRWQDVWDAVNGRRGPTELWRLLRRWLEDRGMADRYEQGITAREAASLGDAFALMRKMERALQPAIDHAAELAPQLGWTTDVPKRLQKSFTGWGTLTVSSTRPSSHGVSFGAYWHSESAETWAGLRVWHGERDTALRAVLMKAADAGALPTTWERAPADEPDAALVRYHRLAAFGDHDALSNWFRDSLEELGAAGILDAILAGG